ncbi:MAG: RDD family protein, partial [Opitutae bacterium]|nr:RDD family protein [Opitutae bacterium]
QAWIQGGRANRQTKARRDGETEWKTLGDFPEFGPAATGAPPSVAGPMPAPGGAVDALAAGGAELAGRWQRLGAAVLDGIIGCAFALPGGAMLLLGGVMAKGSHSANPTLLLPGFLVLGAGILALVIIQIYLLVTRGQTIGKKLLGIKIVTYPDEANPGFVKVWLLRSFVNGLIGAIPMVGGVYSLVDVCFIFREDRRCIHDLIAGTQVVNA